MSGKIINIKTFARVHITLIAMNNQGYRVNGGIGFAISEPNLILNITIATSFEIADKRNCKLDDAQLSRLKLSIEKIKNRYNFPYNIRVEITGNLPIHSGFGSGTIIRLACIEGLFIANGRSYTFGEIAELSGRGGTSGIGIRTYFQGGYIFDIGQRNIGQKLLPSSSVELDPIRSLLISEGSMPDWEIGICFPSKPIAISDTEVAFFEKKALLSNEEIYETLYHVLFGILAGIKENDLQSFEQGVKKIQLSQWKKSERALYGIAIENIESILYRNGAVLVGMSSLGPGLFFIGKNIQEVIENSQSQIPEWDFIQSSAINSARIITTEDA